MASAVGKAEGAGERAPDGALSGQGISGTPLTFFPPLKLCCCKKSSELRGDVKLRIFLFYFLIFHQLVNCSFLKTLCGFVIPFVRHTQGPAGTAPQPSIPYHFLL